jgi:calcineurin-like phosphoesterase
MVTGMPVHFDVATEDLRVCGALVTADTTTGRASAIERIMAFVDLKAEAAKEPPEPAEEGDSPA